MQLRDKTFMIHGRPAHVLMGGTGPRVLLLHGWASRAERYRGVFERIAEAEMNIVIPDLPGFGDTPVPSSVWGIPEYTDWVRELLKELSWDSCILIGHSFGGRIGIFLGATFPHYLTGLVLYAAAGVTPRHHTKLSFFRVIAKIGGTIFLFPGLNKFAHGARAVLYRLVGSSDYHRAGPLREIHTLVVSQDLRPFAHQIRVPTAILWGDRDDATPVSDAHFLHTAIRGSTLTIHPGIGHSIREEQPKLFVSEIQRLVRELSQQR